MATRALLYRRPYEPSILLVKHGSQIYSVRLRRHRRARRYTLRIHPSDREAILTMPPRGTLADARDFAQRHGAWIAARLGRLPKAAPFQPGTIVPLRGVAHRIVHRAGPGAQALELQLLGPDELAETLGGLAQREAGRHPGHRFVIGSRRSFPNALGDTRTPGGPWRRLYSLRSMRRATWRTTSGSWPWDTSCATDSSWFT